MAFASLLRRRLAAALVALAVAATAALPAAAGPLVGVNVTNPQWIDPAGQTQILDGLEAAGVKVIRVPLRPNSVKFVVDAWKRGIDTIAILPLAYEAGAPKRAKRADMPKFWPGVGLSHADPAAFEANVTPMLARLEAAGVRLAAFELGNEINWAAFNQDFPLPGTGRVYGETDLETDPTGQVLAAGFKRYVDTLAMLNRMRSALSVNRGTPIISAGLVDAGQAGSVRPVKADAVALPATLRYLRSLGMDRYVDGYGIHLYPRPRNMPEGIVNHLAAITLSECGVRPCWITEWGAVTVEKNCNTHDTDRLALIDETLQALAPYEANGEVAARILFTWAPSPNDGKRTFSATACGVLTDGGRHALGLQ